MLATDVSVSEPIFRLNNLGQNLAQHPYGVKKVKKIFSEIKNLI
jgi:hypothetical protein